MSRQQTALLSRSQSALRAPAKKASTVGLTSTPNFCILLLQSLEQLSKAPGQARYRRVALMKSVKKGLVVRGIRRIGASARSDAPIRLFKTSGCACCIGWMKTLEMAGYLSEGVNLTMGDLMQKKLKSGLRVDQTSCHTAEIGGYTIEGHVPVRKISRLLREKPVAIGLSVPEMPLGSPGMEYGEGEPYDVLLVARDSSAQTYQRYD